MRFGISIAPRKQIGMKLYDQINNVSCLSKNDIFFALGLEKLSWPFFEENKWGLGICNPGITGHTR